MTNWTFRNIPDQTGRTAIVTGANTGIGLQTARMLALKGVWEESKKHTSVGFDFDMATGATTRRES
jgi:hypothetical protein